MIKEAVILAAGKGSRIRALTDDFPKTLIPFCEGKKIIDVIVDKLCLFGIERIVIVVGYQKNRLIEYMQSRKGVEVEFVYNEDWEKENGISAYLGIKAVKGENSLMLMADHLFETKTIENLRSLDPVSDNCYLLVDRNLDEIFDMDDATKVLTDEKNNIVEIGKNIKEYNAVDTGIFVMQKNIISEFAENIKNKKNTISDTVLSWALKGHFKVIDLKEGYWQDIDTEAGFNEAIKNRHKLLD
jgi:choline kinase